MAGSGDDAGKEAAVISIGNKESSTNSGQRQKSTKERLTDEKSRRLEVLRDFSKHSCRPGEIPRRQQAAAALVDNRRKQKYRRQKRTNKFVGGPFAAATAGHRLGMDTTAAKTREMRSLACALNNQGSQSKACQRDLGSDDNMCGTPKTQRVATKDGGPPSRSEGWHHGVLQTPPGPWFGQHELPLKERPELLPRATKARQDISKPTESHEETGRLHTSLDADADALACNFSGEQVISKMRKWLQDQANLTLRMDKCPDLKSLGTKAADVLLQKVESFDFPNDVSLLGCKQYTPGLEQNEPSTLPTSMSKPMASIETTPSGEAPRIPVPCSPEFFSNLDQPPSYPVLPASRPGSPALLQDPYCQVFLTSPSLSSGRRQQLSLPHSPAMSPRPEMHQDFHAAESAHLRIRRSSDVPGVREISIFPELSGFSESHIVESGGSEEDGRSGFLDELDDLLAESPRQSGFVSERAPSPLPELHLGGRDDSIYSYRFGDLISTDTTSANIAEDVPSTILDEWFLEAVQQEDLDNRLRSPV